MITNNISPYAKKFIKKSNPFPTILDWADELKKGNTSALARAITLIESTTTSDQQKANDLLSACKTISSKSIKLGITGSPGVGKSSFIESFGLEILKDPSYKIAVLTYDPISPLKGGSILGDKTRMQNLSNHPRAFVRPSPSSLNSSINEACRSTIELCEFAGYDFILIETVGAGQSELGIHHLVDYTLLLLNPAGGDELQGIKRGIMEIADLIIVNKDDSGLETAAKTTLANYQNALRLLAKDKVKVMKCSSMNNTGIKEIITHLALLISLDRKNGALLKKRKNQRLYLFKEIIEQQINVKINKILLNKKSKPAFRKVMTKGTNLDKLAADFIERNFKIK